EAEKGMSNLIELIKAVRNIRADANAPLSSPVDIQIKTATAENQEIFEANQEYIERFCHPQTLQISADLQAPTLAMTAVISGAEVYIPLAGLVDLGQEVARLQKEIDKLNNEVTRGEKKLSNQGFVKNAPEAVVAEEQEKLAGYKEKLAATEARIAEVKKEM
ncbi:MAG TPA: valine--tRNA ligase, partial [Candidatus Ligilactobacillus excrementipullorum]|nr:valine--tRNA ligase [Candidatus Ligilactobacillus excrementipullorum]